MQKVFQTLLLLLVVIRTQAHSDICWVSQSKVLYAMIGNFPLTSYYLRDIVSTRPGVDEDLGIGGIVRHGFELGAWAEWWHKDRTSIPGCVPPNSRTPALRLK